MRTFTVHLRPGTAPVLVPEAFSWAAALFGPLWLFAHRAWIAGVLVLCAEAAMAAIPDPALRGVLMAALLWLLGLCGQDLRRWSLARRGFIHSDVVVADSRDGALARLLDHRPDLQQEAVA